MKEYSVLSERIISKLKNNFTKYPALFAVIPYILGILFSYYFLNSFFNLKLLFPLTFQCVLLVLILYAFIKAKKSIKLASVLFFLLLVFGITRFSYVYESSESENISGKVISLEGKDIKIYGSIIELPNYEENRMRFILSSDSISTYNGCIRVKGNVIVSIFQNKYSETFQNKFNYGDYVKVQGELNQLPNRRNPGEFDYGEYLKLHGIEATFTSFGFDKISFLFGANPNYFKKSVIFPIKKFTLNSIDRFMGGDEGEFMKGLVLGERSNISKEIKENFVNDGISHIIAVSGLNVAYVIIVITLILQLFPLKNTLKIFITIIVLLFYMNLTGNVPSIVRATIMSSMFLVSLIFERKITSLNIISLSALIILLIDPRQIFDAGFLLSFWAILSLVFIYPKLRILTRQPFFIRVFSSGNLFGKYSYALVLLILGTLAAQIGTIPITAIMFKKVSTVSLITNIVAIPVSNLAMAMGFLLVIVSLISSWAASLVGIASGFILNKLLGFINFFAHLEFSFIETYSADLFFLFCFYAIVYIILFQTKTKLLTRILISVIIVFNYFTFKSLYSYNGNLNATYMDVGNSSSCLINLPQNQSLMVNCGGSSLKYLSAERNVIPYLKLKGVNCIDALCLTSINKDEFRNLLFFIGNFQVNNIYARGVYKSLINDSDCCKIFSRTKVNYIDSLYDFKENPYYRLFLIPDKSNISTMSVIYIYGSQRFVFADFKSINNEPNFNFCGKFNNSVLKVPSSGSYDFISPEFITKTNPDNIIISSGRERKKYNSDVFTKSIREVGINVFKINETGAVVFESDGEKTHPVDWN